MSQLTPRRGVVKMPRLLYQLSAGEMVWPRNLRTYLAPVFAFDRERATLMETGKKKQ